MEVEPHAFSETSRARRRFGSSIVGGLREGSWLTPGRLAAYPKLFLAAYLATTVVWILLSHGLVDRANHPIGADFIDPWSASSLALKGSPAAVYDVGRLWAAERAAVGYRTLKYAGFHYPPMCLLIVLPLALLPYIWSLLAWTVITLGAYLEVCWKMAPEREALWLAIAFPGALINLANGQNGFLTMAMLGAALLVLESRPVLGGVFFGLMSYKPQFGILVPLFLAVTSRWRAFIAASLTVVAFAGLSFLVFGAQTWQGFFGSISFTRQVVLEHGGPGFGKFQSTFAAARMWGLGVATSYALQGVVGLLAAIGVTWVWRRTARFELQAAALATGALLMSPYMMDYDLAVLAIPIAWLGLEGRRFGFLSWEKSLLAFAWMLPLVARLTATHAKIPLTPIVLLAMVAIIIRRSATTPSAGLTPAPASSPAPA
jgi:Glycosyltransferase family 87